MTTSCICSLHWLGLYNDIESFLKKKGTNQTLEAELPLKLCSTIPCAPGRSWEHELRFKIAETSQLHTSSAEPRRKRGHFWATETSGAHTSLSHSSVETAQSKIWGSGFFHHRFLCFVVPSETLTKMFMLFFSPPGPVPLGLCHRGCCTVTGDTAEGHESCSLPNGAKNQHERHSHEEI